MAASIKLLAVTLAAAGALGFSGCAARAKTPVATAAPPTAPANPAPPPPLSTPQTQIELPKAQPIDPAALQTEPPPQPLPEPPAPSRTPQRRPQPRTTEPIVISPATPPAEQPRPQFQEIVPAADLKRFQESAQAHKKEVTRILASLKPNRLTRAQQTIKANIVSFVELSDEAEKRNEMRMADVLAEKAHILARTLENGK